ncbi:MAG: sodium:solute symporter family protein [Proteobacteria bacterium]|nr:sodium:solute symporter family protein [Pseudomonadota bacterium]
MQIAVIVCFYGLVLAVGLWATRVSRRESGTADLILAGRNLPLTVGLLTMTATWVGGGYINGTAEAVYDGARGLLWAQAPWGYALSLVLGGLFFARIMRRHEFTTMLDPFERRYGAGVAAVLFVPALIGEVFWSAAILAALGTTFGTVLDTPFAPSIVLSAAVVIVYTMFGGLRAVAYTDVVQLLLIGVGLAIAIPFALEHSGGLERVLSSYATEFGAKARPWPSADLGGELWTWLDFALLLALGGVPWQVYFQRVLACRDERSAALMSLGAAGGCLVLAVPAVLIGAIGATADWSAVGVPAPEPALVLPQVLRHWTPPIVATIGLGAVAAAVMSSADSSILSASSLFVWNLYRPRLRPDASPQEMRTVLRVAIAVVGIAATALALQVRSVYALWILCADLVYVILLPQLVMALWFRRANGIGALAGVATAAALRLGGGEPLVGLPAWLPYPEHFPFRTAAMLAGLGTIPLVSLATARLQLPRPLARPR